MNQVVVVGFDLSLRSTGVVVLGSAWTPEQPWGHIAHATFGGEAVEGEYPTERYKRLAGEAVEFAENRVHAGPGVNVRLFVEEYAFGQARLGQTAKLTQLAELCSLVKLYCLDFLEQPVTPITSSAWRKLLLGYGAKKSIKEIAQAELRLAGAPFKSGDECDAFGVANAGRAGLGFPFLTFATPESQNPPARASRKHGKKVSATGPV